MRNLRVAAISFYLVSTVFIAIGMVYLLYPGPMPYHLKFINRQSEELAPEILTLMIFGKEAVGSLLISSGIAVLILTKHLNNARAQLRWCIVAITAPPLAAFLRITLAVGADSPWWAVAICIVSVAIGFFAANIEKNRDLEVKSSYLHS
jgi:hypothetical protein